MKFIKIMSVLCLVLFIAACSFQKTDNEKMPRIEVREKEIGEKKSNETVVVSNNPSGSCDDNSKCSPGEKCIESSCKTVASLYEMNCEKKCSLKQVTLMTNDGEVIILKPGEGNYAYAGAMGFDLLKVPAYCPEQNLVIPLEIEKVTTGKVLNTQVVTLTKGEKSSVISHPTIKRIQFTLEIKEIKEECG